jgi:lysophospholipase L1-like esterase
MSGSVRESRNHIVLLGDSIFDNAAYTQGAPDVVTHLRRLLPDSWQATSCAVDGATTGGLAAQLSRVPVDASHLVIAIGGNDALQNSDLLSLRVASSAQALEIFADRITTFERGYRTVIAQALELERFTAICTVYNGALEPERATIARVALALFNDAILRTAVDLRLDALELRSICTEAADYANPIEPSGQGGLKIARAIGRLVGAVPNAGPPPARVWGNC